VCPEGTHVCTRVARRAACRHGPTKRAVFTCNRPVLVRFILLSIYLYIYISIHLYIYTSIYLYIYISIYLYLYLSWVSRHNHNITRSPDHSISLVANALSPVEWWFALQAASTAGTGSRHCAAAQRGDPQSLNEAS
jgi:Ca2+/Na+ antiporter